MNGNQEVTTPIMPTSFFGNTQVINGVLINPSKVTITLEKSRIEVDLNKLFVTPWDLINRRNDE